MGRIFGEIDGYIEGFWFESRKALSAAGVHRPPQAGISGSGVDGADSIVLSGGYEDDQDLGDIIIYTGHGGRDANTGAQVSDQTLTVGNMGLAKDKTLGLPVRVIRGAQHKSKNSPQTGYRYDGLYRVDDFWHEKGKAGYLVWRFRLVKIPIETIPEAMPEMNELLDEPGKQPKRKEITMLRTVRDTKMSREIKVLYEYRCQICGLQITGQGGLYAEAAHIRPLGRPHNGPDTFENLLCLCPNHHVMFDLGAFTINDDLSLKGIEGRLNHLPQHRINHDHLLYHREHYSDSLEEKK